MIANYNIEVSGVKIGCQQDWYAGKNIKQNWLQRVSENVRTDSSTCIKKKKVKKCLIIVF